MRRTAEARKRLQRGRPCRVDLVRARIAPLADQGAWTGLTRSGKISCALRLIRDDVVVPHRDMMLPYARCLLGSSVYPNMSGHRSSSEKAHEATRVYFPTRLEPSPLVPRCARTSI